MKTKLIFLTIAVGLLSSCASEPVAPTAPAWTKGPARIVEGGYIVYVESSLDANPDLAKFKAEAAALEDLANECTFVPKETRIEDRFLHKNARMHEAFAKVALEQSLCDQARKTLAPEEIRKIANVPMNEQVKRYQDLLGKPDFDEEIADEEIQAPEAPSSSTAENANPLPVYVLRERVWIAKQEVILSPAATFAPGTDAHARYMRKITSGSTQVAQLEAAHPDVRSSRKAWSQYRTAIVRQSRIKAGDRVGRFLSNPQLSTPPQREPSHVKPEKAPAKKKKSRRSKK